MTLFYSELKNEETKEYTVINQEEAKELGWEQHDLDVGYDGNFYEKGYAPTQPNYTWEQIDEMRIQYRHDNIDDKTIARMRKQANGTWTEEDEQAYLALDAEVTAYIEEHYPYPEES